MVELATILVVEAPIPIAQLVLDAPKPQETIHLQHLQKGLPTRGQVTGVRRLREARRSFRSSGTVSLPRRVDKANSHHYTAAPGRGGREPMNIRGRAK